MMRVFFRRGRFFAACVAVVLLAACQNSAPPEEGTEEEKEKDTQQVLYRTLNAIDSMLPYQLSYPMEAEAVNGDSETDSEPAPTPDPEAAYHPRIRIVLGEPLEVLKEKITAIVDDAPKELVLARSLAGELVGVEPAYIHRDLRLAVIVDEAIRFEGPSETRVTNLSVPARTVVGVAEIQNGFARILYRDPVTGGIHPSTWVLSTSLTLAEDRVQENILYTVYQRVARADATAGNLAFRKNLALVLNASDFRDQPRAREIIEKEIPDILDQGLDGAESAAEAGGQTAFERILADGPKPELSLELAAAGKMLPGGTIWDTPVQDGQGNQPTAIETADTDMDVRIAGVAVYFDPAVNALRRFAVLSQPRGWVSADMVRVVTNR